MNPVNRHHVSVTPIPWRPLGQVRTAPTYPVIGGQRRVCASRPLHRGMGWQHYKVPCGANNK